MGKKMWYIASVSGGKDSVAMLLYLIKTGKPLDEVVFYDTGMEFKATYRMISKMRLLLSENNILFTELHPALNFEYKMFEKPVKERGGGVHYGYSWCGGRRRWGTGDKLKYLDQYAKNKQAHVYVGIAADETKRLEKERPSYKSFPLAEWGLTERECLEICYQHGFDWLENGIRLYDILDRVSCWCCANKNLKELENIYRYLPDYWEQLKILQMKTARPMKGWRNGLPLGVFELEQRFRHDCNIQVKRRMNNEKTETV